MIIINKIQLKISQKNKDVDALKLLIEEQLNTLVKTKLIRCNNIFKKGKIPEIGAGYFVGIKLDEPYGKNNGIIKGTHYFDCNDKYGLILRPDKIEIGNFPELDLDDEI